MALSGLAGGHRSFLSSTCERPEWSRLLPGSPSLSSAACSPGAVAAASILQDSNSNRVYFLDYPWTECHGTTARTDTDLAIHTDTHIPPFNRPCRVSIVVESRLWFQPEDSSHHGVSIRGRSMPGYLPR